MLGLWYHTVNYYGGISIRNDHFSQQISAILGYNLYLNGHVTILPVILTTSNFTHTNIDLEIITSINDYSYWGGITFRQSMKYNLLTRNDLVVLLGMGFLRRINSESGKITKPLKVGYSFTLPITNTPTTFHELSISYVIPIRGKRNPPPLRTSRSCYSCPPPSYRLGYNRHE